MLKIVVSGQGTVVSKGDRMLAMMRQQFGGHAVVKDAASESK